MGTGEGDRRAEDQSVTGSENINPSRILDDRYQLNERISNTGFAEVWRGTDTQLQQEIAVKILKSDRRDFVDAALAKAQHIEQLKCRGIVPVLAAQGHSEPRFIVSELIEGGSLSDYVGRQIVSAPQIIRWMTDVGETLEFCHKHELIHGDIKPANILLDLHGRALLTDFGRTQFSHNTGDFGPTRGSLKYLSPEELTGQSPNGRSDLYSLGVVMHELLTGKLPYSSTDPNVLRREISTQAHVDSSIRPRQLQRICARCLQRNPDDRYSSAEQLVDDLRRCSMGSSSRQFMIAGLGILVFVIGFQLSSFWPDQPPAPDASLIAAQWQQHVASLSAKQQVEAVAARLVELNPQFSGELKEAIENGVVVGLEFQTDDVTDISPVSALVGLRALVCCGSYTTSSNGKLTSLSALQGMKLTSLSCDTNEGLDDLTPLREMPLTYLNCERTNVSQLAQLSNTPLTNLVCNFTRVADLSPLEKMKLKELYCDHTQVVDLTPLSGMPLEQFSCQQTAVANLSPLQGAPLRRLECRHTQVSDLSPLIGMNDLSALNVASTAVTDLSPLRELPSLTLLWCDVDEKRDQKILKSLKSVQFINNVPVAEFRRELDQILRDAEAKDDEF